MWRKSLWLAVGLLLLIGSGVVAGLVAMTQHTPAFYDRAAVTPGPERKALSHRFSSEAVQLIERISAPGPGSSNWGGKINEAELNAFFAEDFLKENLGGILPDGASDPRVEIDTDRMRFGFRYGIGAWSTVISVDFKIWLAQKQPNVIVMQITGLHAGSLPISSQSLLEQISTALGRRSIQVNWYRHEGNPTATLKFQSDQSQPTALLRRIELQPGILTIVGQSTPQN